MLTLDLHFVFPNSCLDLFSATEDLFVRSNRNISILLKEQKLRNTDYQWLHTFVAVDAS